MSEELSSYRSGRGPRVIDPNAYQSNAQIVKPIGPSRFTSGGSGSGLVKKGQYIYPKAGLQVFFFSDSGGQSRIMGSKNQVNDPMRTGDELVGTATGLSQKGANGTFIQVDWVNSYTDHNLFKADEKVNEPKVGWVDASKVIWQEDVKWPGDNNMPLGDISGPPPASSGIDTTTLGFGAVAAALILGTKKKKKRR